MFLLDTDVAIHLRDGNASIYTHFDALPTRPQISLLTLVEMEGGIYATPALSTARRQAVDALLDMVEIIPLDAAAVGAYGRIIAALGFSRRRIIDRLIAATAIARGLTLITINAQDFRPIPDLKLEVWPAPAQ